jgi:hypothetical protein
VPTDQKILSSFAGPLGAEGIPAGSGHAASTAKHTHFGWTTHQADPLGVPIVLLAATLLVVGLLAHFYKRARRRQTVAEAAPAVAEVSLIGGPETSPLSSAVEAHATAPNDAGQGESVIDLRSPAEGVLLGQGEPMPASD